MRARVLVSRDLGPRLGLVAGPTMWVVPLGDPDGLTVLPMGRLGPVPAWWGATAGLRI